MISAMCLRRTPLFDALRRRFPQVRIVAGVGTWAMPILENNPNIDATIAVNAPWYNKFIMNRSIAAALRFIYQSDATRAIAAEHFDVGIDVVGSHFGALLLKYAGIPQRLGVSGYAASESAFSAGGAVFAAMTCFSDGVAIRKLAGCDTVTPATPLSFF